MSSDQLPKEFKKTTEVLPFTKYGLSSMQDFQEAKSKVHHLEWLKSVGLSQEEIRLYQENEAGLLEQKKVEADIMKKRLEALYKKIELAIKGSSSDNDELETNTDNLNTNLPNNAESPHTFYPEGHPMNHIKELETDLFGHLKDDLPPLAKRMKMLRRFEKKKTLAYQLNNSSITIPIDKTLESTRKFTMEPCSKQSNILKGTDESWNKPCSSLNNNDNNKEDNRQLEASKYLPNKKLIGPKKRQLYTIKDGNIVRLEPNRRNADEYRAVDIVIPENHAEEQLLEGTKMTIDNIRRIERFKDYEPGEPSKSLYLKNIAPSVSEEQLSLLFNQFVQNNGGPVSVKLMKTGRMRGQAFVDFQDEQVAVEALTEVNGTILSGRPLIAHFARNVQIGPPG